jgi:hypothetical protein
MNATLSLVIVPNSHFRPSIPSLMLKSAERLKLTSSYAVETNANSLFYSFQFSGKRLAAGWRFMIIATRLTCMPFRCRVFTLNRFHTVDDFRYRNFKHRQWLVDGLKDFVLITAVSAQAALQTAVDEFNTIFQ